VFLFFESFHLIGVSFSLFFTSIFFQKNFILLLLSPFLVIEKTMSA